MLSGRHAASLALLEQVPLPAPSFQRSREVFVCTPAPVSDGENAVVAGDQMRGRPVGFAHCGAPRLLKIKPLLPDSSGLSPNILHRPSQVLMAVTCLLFIFFPWCQSLRASQCRSDTEIRDPCELHISTCGSEHPFPLTDLCFLLG